MSAYHPLPARSRLVVVLLQQFEAVTMIVIRIQTYLQTRLALLLWLACLLGFVSLLSLWGLWSALLSPASSSEATVLLTLSWLIGLAAEVGGIALLWGTIALPWVWKKRVVWVWAGLTIAVLGTLAVHIHRPQLEHASSGNTVQLSANSPNSAKLAASADQLTPSSKQAKGTATVVFANIGSGDPKTLALGTALHADLLIIAEGQRVTFEQAFDAQRWPSRISAGLDGPYFLAVATRFVVVDHQIHTVDGVPWIWLRVQSPQGSMFDIYAAHASPPINRDLHGLRQRYFEAIAAHRSRAPQEIAAMVIGDLNATVFSGSLKTLYAAGFRPHWQQLVPTWPQIGWWPGLIGLDQALGTKGLTLGLRAVRQQGSDHRAIQVHAQW